jgi:hypothetical protein
MQYKISNSDIEDSTVICDCRGSTVVYISAWLFLSPGDLMPSSTRTAQFRQDFPGLYRAMLSRVRLLNKGAAPSPSLLFRSTRFFSIKLAPTYEVFLAVAY